jgi:protein O-GlcNAc transferase
MAVHLAGIAMNDLSEAIELWRLGQREQARTLCEALVAQPGNVAQALSVLAEIYSSTGEHSKAIQCLQRLVESSPADAAAHRKLGDAQLAVGANPLAAKAYGEALRLEPDNVRCHNNLGLALLRQGSFDRAIERFEAAIARQPNYAVALKNLEMALTAQAAAIPNRASRSPVSQGRESAQQAFAQLQQGRPADALKLFEQALQWDPECIEALIGSTSALLHLGRPRQALPFNARALRLRADSAEVRTNCAAVFLALERPQEALTHAERAVQLGPDLFQAHFNHAEALRARRQHNRALEAYDRTLALRPQFVPAHCGRGQTCREMGDERVACAHYRRALSIEPDNVAARFGVLFSNLPMIPGPDGELDHARREFAAELARFDDWQASHDNLDDQFVASMTPPFYLAYHERSNRELLSRCGQLYVRVMARWAMRRTQSAQQLESVSDPRIHLGIVTAHVHEHSVFRALIKGWLGHLDRARVRITVFNLGIIQDSSTRQAQERAEFIECGDRSLSECVQDIRGHSLDVLFYPEVGMDLMTLQLACLRLVPHQVAAWGHPETTGLPTIDCYLSAAAFEPADAEQYYSEQLIRLPNLGCYYEPYGLAGTAPDLEALGIAPHMPLLVCAGTPYKYGAEHDGVLVDIARELVRCQIVFFQWQPRALSGKLLARLHARFRDAGLDPGRYLVIVPWMSQEAFFGLLRRADVYLDSPGFSGFNTVMQAVECELPVVAYEGRLMRSRFASGILRRIGLDELVADNHARFVQQATRLARDAEFRDTVRTRLRRERAVLYRDHGTIDALMEFIATRVATRAPSASRG